MRSGRDVVAAAAALATGWVSVRPAVEGTTGAANR
jgi:hypothetical protein